MVLALLGPVVGPLAQGHHLSFGHLSLEQGLSQSTVFAILQDRRGFLWIGTQDGLNRYDGYRFKVYKRDPDDPESLGSNTIHALYEDREGVLWVGTFEGGLNRYDRAGDRFTAFRHDPDDPTSLGGDTVWAIAEDRAGTLWIGTEGGGLSRLDASGRAAGTFTRYLHDPGDPSSLRSNTVRAIYEDRAGELWIGTEDGGLNRLDRPTETFTAYRHDPTDPTSIQHDTVYAIEEDEAGSLWLGTFGGGLSRFDRASETFTAYRHDPTDPTSLGDDQVYVVHEERPGVLWVGTRGGGLNRLDVEAGEFLRFRHDPSESRSLSNDLVHSIYEDLSGTLWIGTDSGGVDKLDFTAQKFAHYQHNPTDPGSLANNTTLAFYEDQAGLLWVGTWGGGLDRFDDRSGIFTHFRHDPADSGSIGGDVVYALCEDHTGTLWIGTEEAGLQRFDSSTETFVSYRHDPEDPGSIGDDDILSLHEGRDGTLWIGTWDRGLDRYDRRNDSFTHYPHDDGDPKSLSGNRIYALHEDRQGVLWVGTETHGLNAFDRQSGTFTRYQYDELDPASLSSTDVMAIYEDRSGTLWVGTYGGGLNQLDRASGTFRHYDERDGLPNNVVYGILEDSLGRLWLSTNKGLSRFDPRTESFRNYDVHDGLQSQEFNSGAFHQSRRGLFFFGGSSGFNAFFPERVRDNPYIPPVVLTSFKKFNEEATLETAITEVEAITLGPEDSVFSFEFAALSYTVPQKNRYAYKLEGFSEEWIELGTKRDITFTNLNPGSYVFRVKGSNNDGAWNEEGVAVELIVLPPFWATWWFRTLAALSLLLALAGVYQIRTRNVRARNQQLEAMNLELEAKNAQLERFTYTVSHDLKSPLVTIKGFLGFLQRDALAGDGDRVKQDVARIGAAADKMARLLDDLLELSRIGRVIHAPEAVSLSELVHEAAGLVAGKAEARGVTIDIEPAMPVVFGDRVRLLEVFQNLLENAVHFMGDQQQPRVEIGAREEGDEVLCRVRDNGIGIDPQYQTKIFALFERLDPETGDTGIGLALVERIVEAHGGRIWVESEGAGCGSTFCCILPKLP